MAKKPNPFLEKLEEKKGKGLDGDGEKGESKTHRAKVFGKGKTLPVKTVKGKKTPPLMKNKKVTLPNDKKSNPSPGNGDKMCPPCKRVGASSCSHM